MFDISTYDECRFRYHSELNSVLSPVNFFVAGMQSVDSVDDAVSNL